MKKGIFMFVLGGFVTVVGAILTYSGERVYFIQKTDEEMKKLRQELTEGTD